MALFTGNVAIDLLGVCIAFFAIIYTYFKWSFNYWQRRGVYVPHQPIFPLGNFINPISKEKGLLDVVNTTYHATKKIKARYGGCYFLQSPQLVIVNPEIIRLIMSKDFHHFNDRGFYYNAEKNPLSVHLFNIAGPKWKHLRAKLTPTFTSGKMKMMFNGLIECGGPLLESIAKQTNAAAIDIKEVLGNFTTDVIGSCVFGLECSSFASEESDFRRYGKRCVNAPLKARWIDLFGGAFPTLAKKLGLEVLDNETIDFFMNIIKNNIEFRERNNYKRNDFFQLLMDIKTKSEESGETPFTMNEFAAQAFVFFLAGFETSSTTMTFALYELAKNRELQKRVRQEIDAVLKQHDGKLTYDAMQDMKYLRCVVDETLRMYPPGPVLARLTTETYKIPNDPLTIEKSIRCLIPVFSLHRDADYFPEPDTFKPERFSDENKANIQPYTYLPFGEGPKNCIGLRFGLMQSLVGLALLLKHFEFLPSAKTLEPLRFDPGSFVLAAKGDIWLQVKNIDSNQRAPSA